MSENLIAELYSAVATVEADYVEAKQEARNAKDEANQAVADRYWKNADEPNVEELAEIFGKSVAFATATLKAAGVELTSGKRGRPSKFSEAQQAEIAQKFADASDKFEQMELALEHRVAVETIKGWAVKAGLVEVKTRAKQDA